MTIARSQLIGPPHRYAITFRTVRGLPLLRGHENHLATFLPLWAKAHHLTLWAAVFTPSSLSLVLRHRLTPLGQPHYWQRLYHEWQPSSRLAPDRIAERVGSVSHCLQSLTQRLSRERNQRAQERGSCWEPRFRSCLLADDAGLLAAIIALSTIDQATLVINPINREPLETAALPIAVLPNGDVIPADQGSLLTPPDTNHAELFDSVYRQYHDSDRELILSAMQKTLALGKPESLAETLGRFERPASRGRRRSMQEIGDSWGLCGVWG